MTNTKRLVPELRFPEFNGEWEKRKLKDIANFQNGKAHEKLVSISGDFVLVNSKFISTNTQVKKFVSQQLTPLNKEDIAIVMSDIPNGKALAKCFLVNENNKYTLNQRVGRIYDISGDSRFLYAILNRNTQLLKYDNGVGQTNLKKSEITHIVLKCPKNAEQKKIGDFFSKLDHQIELEEEKLELLEQQKKGYIQKIFSQELQFKDKITNNFDNWSEFKIKDIFSKIESGNRLPKSNLLDGDIPYVIAQTTNNGVYMNISKDTLDYHGNNLKKFKKGSITISIDNPDAMFIQTHDFVTSNVMRVLYNEKLSIEAHTFILYSLRKLTQTYNWSVKFSGPIIMDSKIKLPVKLNTNDIDWNIVNKIGEFLTKLDFKIYQKTTKVELLKQRKQGLLQKMFI